MSSYCVSVVSVAQEGLGGLWAHPESSTQGQREREMGNAAHSLVVGMKIDIVQDTLVGLRGPGGQAAAGGRS